MSVNFENHQYLRCFLTSAMISVSLETARSDICAYQIIEPFLQTNWKDKTCAYHRQMGGAKIIIQISCKTNGSATGTIEDNW